MIIEVIFGWNRSYGHPYKVIQGALLITVYNAEWKNLRAMIDVEALKPSVFYLSAESNQLQILSQFKSAFKLSRMTEFSVAYCCEVFGVDAKLVNSIVQQDLR
ncbi:Hypothetical_protein [Hexamita inflata]|uniref:Hypothetical_protein n=1 Tax=Hexamita inflata TaxID=28002 RepID=A0AA86PKX1_9EUKA|nr:Hypothetical protein HINF_LOCUS29525 [Hexamita inflata]